MPLASRSCRTRFALPLALVCFFLALSLAACAAPMHDGVTLYDHARYPEALESLREAERDLAAYDGAERARYALYRGLVHLALGDPRSTCRWLSEAKAAYDANPLIFDDDDAGRLASALAHLPPSMGGR